MRLSKTFGINKSDGYAVTTTSFLEVNFAVIFSTLGISRLRRRSAACRCYAASCTFTPRCTSEVTTSYPSLFSKRSASSEVSIYSKQTNQTFVRPSQTRHTRRGKPAPQSRRPGQQREPASGQTPLPAPMIRAESGTAPLARSSRNVDILRLSLTFTTSRAETSSRLH